MLREHFKSNHFVCEEGECANELLTSAFRSEIDLKGKRIQDAQFYEKKIVLEIHELGFSPLPLRGEKV